MRDDNPVSDAMVVVRENAIAASKGRSRRSARRSGLVAATVAIVAGLSWFGYGWWTEGRFIESTDDAYVGGNVTAIAPHVGGFVADVLVEDNQRVHAGQVLIRLDRRDYQAALDHATALVDARAAALEGLRARNTLQQAVIRQQQANVASKAARAAFTTQEAERYRSLALTSAGSRQESQRSSSLDQEGRAAVAASFAGLEAARQQTKVLDAQIAEADATLAQARAELQTAQLDLGYTELRTPIDGYVGNRAAQVGAYVAPGAYLVSIVPAAGLWVDANFKESQLAGMAKDQSVTMVVDTLPGHIFHGRIVSIAPGTGAIFSVIPPENATGNFTKIVQRVPVRVAVDGGDASLPALRPGLSATVHVDMRTERAATP